MKKPVNKFARIVWGLLAVYILINIDIAYFISVLQALQSTIYAAVVFGSAAVLIELVDQIRWNALPLEERSKT